MDAGTGSSKFFKKSKSRVYDANNHMDDVDDDDDDANAGVVDYDDPLLDTEMLDMQL